MWSFPFTPGHNNAATELGPEASRPARVHRCSDGSGPGVRESDGRKGAETRGKQERPTGVAKVGVAVGPGTGATTEFGRTTDRQHGCSTTRTSRAHQWRPMPAEETMRSPPSAVPGSRQVEGSTLLR